MEEKTLLTGIAESLQIPRPPRSAEDSIDISDFAQTPAVREWLLSRQTSVDAVQKVVNQLEAQREPHPSVLEFMEEQTENIVDQEAVVYDHLLKAVCKEVRKDVDTNDGKNFLRIVQRSDEHAIHQILGNEELRDWLFERSKSFSGLTIYDVEEAAVKAVILNIATKHTALFINQSTPPSWN